MAKRNPGVSDRDLEQLSSLFRLLADKTRISILLRLAEGERNVTDLCEDLSLPQPTVSHHLGLLRMNNLVGNRRQGKQVYYNFRGIGTKEADGLLAFAVQNLEVEVRYRGRM